MKTNLRAMQPDEPEPRWPALIAVIAVAGMEAALPSSLTVGPRWLLPGIVGVVVVMTFVAHAMRRVHLYVIQGHILSAVLTGAMLWSLILLVRALPAHKEAPVPMLWSAALLWITNVLVFALWYWRLDAGGPHARDLRPGHEAGAFLFPQMTLEGPVGEEPDGDPWSPRFVDYLFLAFNTSTAFSPTDVPVLGRWAKALVMLQSLISLTVVVILAARAINTL